MFDFHLPMHKPEDITMNWTFLLAFVRIQQGKCDHIVGDFLIMALNPS